MRMPYRRTTEEQDEYARMRKLSLTLRKLSPEIYPINVNSIPDSVGYEVRLKGKKYPQTFLSIEAAYEHLVEEGVKNKMSIENHPNFQAAGFVSDLITSVVDRLRGEAPQFRKEILERMHPAFISITEQVEQTVDYVIREEKGKQHEHEKGEL